MSYTKHQYLRILPSLAYLIVLRYQQCIPIMTSQLRTADLISGADLTPNPWKDLIYVTPSFLSLSTFSCQCDQSL